MISLAERAGVKSYLLREDGTIDAQPESISDITLAQALEGYFIHAEARNLSPHTLADYGNVFTKFTRFIGADFPIAEISKEDIKQFLISLDGLSNKTRLNHHVALSALWTWLLSESLVEEHIVRQVKAPRPEQRVINPFTQQEVKQMMGAIALQRKTYQVRNRAIFFILLDTGCRASELCGLTLADTNLKTRQLKLFGKGAKERVVPISPKTSQVIWRYLSARRKNAAPGEPLILGPSQIALTRSGLLQVVKKIGNAAGVAGVHPHRFRHTFAVTYLKNGGDIYSLQNILGHSNLRMVSRYLNLATADVQARHRAASPVMNWRLS